MVHTAYNTEASGTPVERKTFANGYVFGAPVRDLGWLASLIMAAGVGMSAFFLATFFAIVTILYLNAGGRHHYDFAMTYRWIGIPAGVTVLLFTLAYLGTFWARRIFRKA